MLVLVISVSILAQAFGHWHSVESANWAIPDAFLGLFQKDLLQGRKKVQSSLFYEVSLYRQEDQAFDLAILAGTALTKFSAQKLAERAMDPSAVRGRGMHVVGFVPRVGWILAMLSSGCQSLCLHALVTRLVTRTASKTGRGPAKTNNGLSSVIEQATEHFSKVGPSHLVH